MNEVIASMKKDYYRALLIYGLPAPKVWLSLFAPDKQKIRLAIWLRERGLPLRFATKLAWRLL